MAKRSSEWVEEETVGTRAVTFWWRVGASGELTILRVMGKKRGRREIVRTLSREELEGLVEFMGDGTWRPLAASVGEMRGEMKPDGVGSFLYHGIRRPISHCKIVSELAAVMVRAGLWEWDGKLWQSRFRQVDGDLGRLASCFAERQAEGSDGPPEGVRRQQTMSAPVPPPGFDLARSFRGRAAELRGRLARVSDGRHGGSKGQRRETVFRDLFRQQLAARYGVGAGEVAEPSGEMSGQVDIVVYDALESDPLIGDPEAMVLAAESVYAAIEVKPILDAAFLREAVETVRSVKVLPRSALDRSPGRGPKPPMENPPVFGAVVGCRGTNPERLARKLVEMQARTAPALWVDAVWLLDEAVVHRQGDMPGPTGWRPELNDQPTPYAVVECGEDSLLYFLTLLRCDLRRKHLWPYDPVSYARGMRAPKAKRLGPSA